MRALGGFGTLLAACALTATALAATACGTGPGNATAASTGRARPSGPPKTSASPRPLPPAAPPPAPARPAPPRSLPEPGNPSGHAPVPAAGQPVDTSHPTHVIGDGTPASCTSAAVVAAVAEGGIITFSCGPQPVTITMQATAKVVNTSAEVVLDGGGKVTLSGGGGRRVLYMDTSDPPQHRATSHCQDQPAH